MSNSASRFSLSNRRTTVTVAILLCAVSQVVGDEPLQYNRDIRPILAENCFACHGLDNLAREADLRLDLREAAIESGAIQPGEPDDSEMITRVTSDDDDSVMPPPDTKKHLSVEQRERLKRWIAEGATYEKHWSLIKPQMPRLPEPDDSSQPRNAWAKNEIDLFVLDRLQREGLEPAAEAEPRTLFRRLSLDITGLPPDAADVDSFVADFSQHGEAALSQAIDQLMESAAWGEHRGRYWLDAARYADTHGMHFDNYREMWPYRDWVIRSFNKNQPFDQFTVEQLAGDMLENPTTDQLVATGFQRCAMSTNEGGTIDEENLAIYAADRVQTFGWVYLGLTTNCCQCHDHKFDPLTMKDYYSLAAYFRNTTQPAKDQNTADGGGPVIRIPVGADRDRWNTIDAEIAAAETAHDADTVVRLKAEREAIEQHSPITHIQTERTDRPAMANILMRGEYDNVGDEVRAAPPAALHSVSSDEPHNRLGLARWVVDPENPLTARVTVNRFWQQIFGQGIVATAEDFGVMGAAPTHPELLDWLAVDFVDSGWDVKRFFKQILMSATYRQAAIVTPEKLAKDRDNAIHSRGPRFRMDAEMVRDYALSSSGLLSPTMFGPGTRPYQPTDIWSIVGLPESNTRVYTEDHGENLYRRSLYTFWKRMAPPPSLEAFNAPSREVCTVRRERTNTPLQALVTLNDPQYVEAAFHLAKLAIHHSADDDVHGLDFVARRVLSRPLTQQEADIASATHADLTEYYREHADDAMALLDACAASEWSTGTNGSGDTQKSDGADEIETLDASRLAAWTMTCNGIMNLDEALNK